MLARAYLLVRNTGMYNDTCREWRKTAAVQQTWTNFKKQFTEAHRDLIHNRNLEENQYHHTANAVLEAFEERTTQAIARIEATTTSDNLEELAEQNSELRTQVANATTDITSLKGTIELLRTAVESMNTNNADNRGRQGQTRIQARNRNRNNTSYWWTRGRTRNNNHTSESCNHKAEGHKNDATLENKKGGSTKYCE